MTKFTPGRAEQLADTWHQYPILPSELPDVSGLVVWDTETCGLFPDDGARVSTLAVSWWDGQQTQSYAWPFFQGLYNKPEYETARYGWLEHDDVYKSGPRKGEPCKRRIRKLEAHEVLEPDPNLDATQWEAAMDWLMSRRGLVAHNALFDVVLTSAGAGYLHTRSADLPGPPLRYLLDKSVWCTMIGQHVLEPQYPLGLKPTADRLWGQTADEETLLKEHLKSRGLPHRRYDLADWEVIGPYAAGDTERTLKLAMHQWKQLRARPDRMAEMDFEMEVMAVLARMEHRGVPYNAAESLRWAAKMQERVAELDAMLPFEPTDPGARSYFFGSGHVQRRTADQSGGVRTPALGLTPLRVTEKTKVACIDSEQVRLLVGQQVPHAATFQEYGLVSDAVSRYYLGYAKATAPDGRLRTRFKQWTSTGRTSCERVNVQAVPHDHRLLAIGSQVMAAAPSPRALIEVPDGWELWHMDLMQAELRVASQFAGCKPMIEIFSAGRDPHGETAINLGIARGPSDPDWKLTRGVIGKRGNFSLIFGIGHVKFRDDVRRQSGLDLESPAHVCITAGPGSKGKACRPNTCKVKKIVDDWRELYPEFGRAIELHSRMAERDGYTMIRAGYKKWYTELEKKLHDQHKAFNNRVQGNIGLLTKTWAVRVDRMLMDEGIDPDRAGLLLNIHDALVTMLPAGYGELADRCAQIGRDLWDEWFEVPGGVDLSFWQKG